MFSAPLSDLVESPKMVHPKHPSRISAAALKPDRGSLLRVYEWNQSITKPLQGLCGSGPHVGCISNLRDCCLCPVTTAACSRRTRTDHFAPGRSWNGTFHRR